MGGQPPSRSDGTRLRLFVDSEFILLEPNCSSYSYFIWIRAAAVQLNISTVCWYPGLHDTLPTYLGCIWSSSKATPPCQKQSTILPDFPQRKVSSFSATFLVNFLSIFRKRENWHNPPCCRPTTAPPRCSQTATTLPCGHPT